MTQHLAGKNLLELLVVCLDDRHEQVRRLAALALSNAMTSERTLQLVVENQTLTNAMNMHIQADSFKVKKELLFGFANAVQIGNNQQLCKLLDLGVLEVFVQALHASDAELLVNVLTALLRLGQLGERVNPNTVILAFRSLRLPQLLQQLQYHENNKVYQLAVQILENHFPDDIVYD